MKRILFFVFIFLGICSLAQAKIITVTLTDESTTLDFYNYQKGSISGHKWSDLDGDGRWDRGESTVSDWTIYLDDEEISTETDEDGGYTFSDLEPGDYTVCEEDRDDWRQTYPQESSCHTITVNSGDESTQNDFGNQQLGKIIVKKVTNQEEDQTEFEFSSSYHEGKFYLSNGDEDVSEYLEPGNYSVNESEIKGWKLVNSYCDNEDSPNEISLRGGQTVTCTFENEWVQPSLQLVKLNNAVGSLSAGNTVEYRIKIKVKDNGVDKITVTDLPPEGFKYRTGSYKVYRKSGLITDDITPLVTAPIYHSPGVWEIGPGSVDDEFELVYLADIDSAQDPGTYQDLVWAKGDTYLASVPSTDASYVNDIFAGTQVTVDKNLEKSASINIEKKVEGQVLGATTSLPATGANELWLMLAAMLIGTGSLSIYYGIKKTNE